MKRMPDTRSKRGVERHKKDGCCCFKRRFFFCLARLMFLLVKIYFKRAPEGCSPKHRKNMPIRHTADAYALLSYVLEKGFHNAEPAK